MRFLSLVTVVVLAQQTFADIDLQKRIDGCAAAGGGRVSVPAGEWETGPLRLRSNVELHLDEGAVLRFSDRPEDYLPAVEVSWEGVECQNYRPLVYAYGATNVAITGTGTLAPRIEGWIPWFDRKQPAQKEAIRVLYGWSLGRAPLAERPLWKLDAHSRPHLIHLNRCRGVRLEGFRIRESPFWCVHLYRSQDIVVRGLDISALRQNNDGVDIEMSRNVLVEGCHFNQGDDAIVLKAGRNSEAYRFGEPTENVTVRNCRAEKALTLVSIGSEMSGGVRNVRVSDCSVGTVWRLAHIKTNERRGGEIANVTYERLHAGRASEAIVVQADAMFDEWRKIPSEDIALTDVHDISCRDITCDEADQLAIVRADVRRPFGRISFENVAAKRVNGRAWEISDADVVFGTGCPGAEEARPYPRVTLGGFAGEKAETLLAGRVFSAFARGDSLDETVNAFRTHYDDLHRKGSGTWQGEYWGKTLLGHTGAWRFTGRPDLPVFIRRECRRLVDGFMREDGYLGTYADAKFVKGSWNLWGRKYTLWALVESYEATGDRAILDAAVKTADQAIAMLKEMGVPVRETGCFNGLPTASVLSPLVRLYRHVPKASYLEHMRGIVADWDRADGAAPNLIANAFTGKPVHAWYPEPVIWAKSYEMMSCYEGLVDYAELTGERRPLEAAERFADLLEEHEGNALGCVGYYDHFTHAAANPNATIEMCDVVYWMRLCHALYRATGGTRHLDRVEKAFCNAFLAGLYKGGRWGAYSVRSHGYRHGTAALQIGMRHHCCCVDNSPRGFYDFAEHAVWRRGETVEVNQYLPLEADLGQGVRVTVGGNYPVSESATVSVEAAKPTAVALRVPGWCEAMEVDGKRVAARNGRVELTANGKVTYKIRFAMPVRIVRRPDVGVPALAPGHESDGKGNDGSLMLFELQMRFPEMLGTGLDRMAASVMRGPLILAKARLFGSSEKEIFAVSDVNGEDGWTAEARPLESCSDCWGAWELTLRNPRGEKITAPVCDLPSAAPSDDWQNAFSIWF